MNRVASRLLLVVLGATGMVAWMPPAANPAVAGIVSVDGGGPGGPNVGEHTSMVLDSAGNPVVSYYDATNDDLKLAHCNNPDCANGDVSIAVVDSVGDVGRYTSLQLDGNGNPVISYYDATNGDLKLAHCNDPYCLNGDESGVVVDGAGIVGLDTSLELTPDGHPVIAYYDSTNGDLKATQCGDVNCTDPGPRVAVDSGGDVGWYASLEIGDVTMGRALAVISYQDRTNGDLKLAMCGIGPQSCVTPPTILSLDTDGFTGVDPSLSLRSFGLLGIDLAVSYFDATTAVLKVAELSTGLPDDGLEITVVDSDGVVGTNSSSTYNGAGHPVIAYADVNNGDLKIATCGGTFCAATTPTIATVDSVGIVGVNTSLQYNAAVGRAVVSYHDVTNGDLKVLADDSPGAGFEPIATPRPAAVDEVDVIFTERVTGADVGDFRLTHDGEELPLDGATLSTADGITHTLTGLGPLTAPGDRQGDDYVLEMLDGHGIRDAIGNPLKGTPPSVSFTVDPLPTVTIDPIGSALRTQPPDPITVRFSEPVSGFTNGDIAVSRDGTPLDESLLLVILTSGGRAYTVLGISELDIVPGGNLRDGTYLIEITGGVADSSGQDVAQGTSVTFTIDNTASEPSINLDPAAPDGNDDWYVSPVGVTVTAIDPHLAELRCALDPAETPGSFGELPPEPCLIGAVGTDGSHIVYAAAADELANESNVVATAFRIDRMSPQTTIELDPSVPDGADGSYVSPVAVSVSTLDANPTQVRCALDPASAPATFADLPSAPCDLATVDVDGDHVVYAASVDEAGHPSPMAEAGFRIDLTAPETTITLDPAVPDGSDGSDGEYASPVTVNVATDDEAATVRCVLDPAAPPTSFDELPDAECAIGTVGDEAEHAVYAAAIDAAGNRGPVAEAAFDIDLPVPANPPAGTLELTVSDPTPQPGQTITLSATGFAAGETVEVVLYSERQSLTTATVDDTGELETDATIPDDTGIGTHTLAVYGDDDVATATIEVTAAPSGSGTPQPSGPTSSGGTAKGSSGGSLGSTGVTVDAHVGLAAAAILAGALLVAGSSRRRARSRIHPSPSAP